MSFRKRLTLFSAVGIAVVLVVGSAATHLIVRTQLRGEIDESLRKQAAAVRIGNPEDRHGSVQTRPEPGTASRASGPPVLSIVAPESEFGSAPLFFQLIDGQGEAAVPGGGRLDLPVSQRAAEVARTGSGAYYTDVEVKGTAMRMYVTPAGSGRALVAARSLTEVDNALNRLGWSLAVTCLFGIAIAALVGAIVARGALRPVRSLTVTAERITDTHDLGERIETEGNDEVSRLGSTFNAMLDSLEGAIRSQRQLVSDASHELRTPLTSLRTNIEVLSRADALPEAERVTLLHDVTEQLTEMTALIAELVELARGDQAPTDPEDVRLDLVTEEAIERTRRNRPGVAIAADLEETLVRGVPATIERAISNLLDNAAKWSPPGGEVEVSVHAGEICVRDHGPGISDDDLPFVFDRFYRAPSARGMPGSGLGLSIVRQVAEAHGGTVTAEAAEGGGTRMRLKLNNSS